MSFSGAQVITPTLQRLCCDWLSVTKFRTTVRRLSVCERIKAFGCGGRKVCQRLCCDCVSLSNTPKHAHKQRLHRLCCDCFSVTELSEETQATTTVLRLFTCVKETKQSTHKQKLQRLCCNCFSVTGKNNTKRYSECVAGVIL